MEISKHCVVILVDEPACAAAVAAALSDEYVLVYCDQAKDFQHVSRTASCAVVAAANPSADLMAAISTAQESMVPPLVRIRVGGTVENQDCSPTPRPYLEISEESIAQSLLRVVSRAVVHHLLIQCRNTVNYLASAGNTPNRLERALARAFEMPPLKSVHTMARTVKCGRRHLEKQWSGLLKDTQHPTLIRFINAILFLMALDVWQESPHTTWVTVARRLNVSPETLRNVSKRIAGVPPSKLAIRDVPDLALRIEQEVLASWLSVHAS